jgi:hypothetical protein
MAVLRGVNFPLPGSYGLNTQSDIADDQALRFVSEAKNGVIDASGKLTSRKDFVLQTSGFSEIIDTIYTHRKNDGSEIIMSAGSGIIYSGLGTLTSRFDYRAGSQLVDVGGAKTAATATGLLNDATVYGFTVAIDGGAAQQISVTGSAAQTYATLLTEINADLTGATCALVGGNLKITSDTTGASSTVAISNVAGTASAALLSTLTNFVAVRTASPGTSTNDHWQFATLNSRIFAAQKNQQLVCLLESDFSEESIIGQPWTGHPNVVIAADGRLWAADDEAGSNRYTVWWSNLLDGKTWNSGDAGSLDVRNVWPSGQDSIIGIEFLSGRLIIFGRHSILLYTLPADHDPANMSLTDTVEDLGCIARDSIRMAGGDIYFLSDDGLYKIPRLAQVTSLLAPVKVSKLVDDDFNDTFANEDMRAVRSGYYPTEKWYVINAPLANKTWCFHLNRMVPDQEVPAVTDWTNSAVAFRGFAYDKDKNWYCAMRNGIGKYTGYTPDGASNAYSFDVYTQWNHLQDETRLKHLKNWAMTLETDSGQTGTFRWQVDHKEGTTRTQSFTCSATEFAEAPGKGIVKGSLGGSCNIARFGFTSTINGDKVALHSLRIYAAPGATKVR